MADMIATKGRQSAASDSEPLGRRLGPGRLGEAGPSGSQLTTNTYMWLWPGPASQQACVRLADRPTAWLFIWPRAFAAWPRPSSSTSK